MKRTNRIIAIAVALLIGLPTLHAQTTNVVMTVPTTTSISGTVQVNIPFAFSVAGKTFAAGEYAISPSDEKGITIKSVKGNSAAMVLTNAVGSSKVEGPKLVFHKYGDKYFLTQTWLRASDRGRELFASPEEIRMAREYHQQQVTLVAAK